MNVRLSSLYNIGTNYAVKLNEKELLIYEKDERYAQEKTPHEKELEKQEKAQEEKKKKSSDELSEDELKLLKDLQARDTEVRAHESAHQAAGSGLTGAASFTYQQGPDGKMYAIGGEVSISMKSGSTPQETIANARQIAAAAMAPSSPSPQDYAVATSARMMEMKAQQQLIKEQQDAMLGKETYSTAHNNTDNDKSLDISA